MKTSLTLLLVSALPAVAQTAASSAAPAKSPARSATHRAATAGGGCVKLPELSSKIPALAAGLTCAKPLYTITTQPAIKLDYVSPLEGESLKETLGLDGATFSLAYVDTKVGTGELAKPHKWYSIHYTGYLTDGTKFDSSVDRGEPITIPYGQHKVIPGWDTGFDGMRVGGKRRLFIPYQLGYGATPHQSIPAKSELIFDVELVAMSDTQPAPKTPPAGAHPATPPAAGSRPTPPGAATAPGSTAPATSSPATPPAAAPGATPATPPPATTPKP